MSTYMHTVQVIFVFVLSQVDWLNKYHKKTREVIGAELQKRGKTKALEWLEKETEPIVY